MDIVEYEKSLMNILVILGGVVLFFIVIFILMLAVVAYDWGKLGSFKAAAKAFFNNFKSEDSDDADKSS